MNICSLYLYRLNANNIEFYLSNEHILNSYLLMTILIPTNDQQSIAPHFGRANGYVKLKIEDGNIQKQFFANRFTHHHNKQVQSHSHKDLIDIFSDCEIVIAAGMGRRLFNEFKSANKKIYFSDPELIDSAITLLQKGNLSENHDHLCHH